MDVSSLIIIYSIYTKIPEKTWVIVWPNADTENAFRVKKHEEDLLGQYHIDYYCVTKDIKNIIHQSQWESL